MFQRSFRSIRFLILTAALLAAIAPDLLSPHSVSWADVGEVPYPGGLVTPGDKTDEIRMKSESVLFSVRPDDGTFAEQQAQYSAHVTADFVMQNLSAKVVSKDLFFPLHSWQELSVYQEPANAVMQQAKNVKVRVDGKEVQISYADLALSPQEKVVAAVFPVRFPAGRETAIQVEYDVRAVNEAKMPSLSLKYMMQTGSQWAGTIGSGKVIFEFWQPLDSKSALLYVNDFFQIKDGRLEWNFADLEPTPDHDITLTFEPAALESWLGRPSYVSGIRASDPGARGISDAAREPPGAEDFSGTWDSSLVYLLGTAHTERGWVAEQAKDPGGAWLQVDLDRAHTLLGLRIRTGIVDYVWKDPHVDVRTEVFDTFRRPRTVVISLSGGFTQTVTLADTPKEWQVIPLPNRPTTSLRLSFLDSYPGVGRGDAYLGVGRIELLGVDAGGAGEGFPGACTGPNLLRNGDFEQGFDRQGIGLGWTGFSSGGAGFAFSADPWAAVVYQGEHSQLIAIATNGLTPAADRYAGISQAISGLEPGAVYELALAGMLREEAAHPDEDAYRYRVQWAFAAGGLDWTQVAAWQELPWDTYSLRTEPGAFSTYTAHLLATRPSATLFLRVWKKWATSGRELDVNLDAITLRRCGSAPAAGP